MEDLEVYNFFKLGLLNASVIWPCVYQIVLGHVIYLYTNQTHMWFKLFW